MKVKILLIVLFITIVQVVFAQEYVPYKLPDKGQEEIYTVCGQSNDDNVRVRKLPILEDNIIGELQKKDKVNVVGQSDFVQKIGKMNSRWVQIEWDGGLGWVYGYFVTLETGRIIDLPIIMIDEENSKIPKKYLSYEDLELLMSNKSDAYIREEILGKKITSELIENLLGEGGKKGKHGGEIISFDVREGMYDASYSSSNFSFKKGMILLFSRQAFYKGTTPRKPYLFDETILDYLVIPDRSKGTFSSIFIPTSINGKFISYRKTPIFTKGIWGDERCYSDNVDAVYMYNIKRKKIDVLDIPPETVRLHSELC